MKVLQEQLSHVNRCNRLFLFTRLQKFRIRNIEWSGRCEVRFQLHLEGIEIMIQNCALNSRLRNFIAN